MIQTESQLRTKPWAMAASPQVPRLSNKVAVITGAASGLGRAISLAYASHGTKLVVCADLQPKPRAGIDTEQIPTHEIINSLYGAGKAVFVRTDVGDSRSMEMAIEEAVRLGGRLDV